MDHTFPTGNTRTEIILTNALSRGRKAEDEQKPYRGRLQHIHSIKLDVWSLNNFPYFFCPLYSNAKGVMEI
jgi:hypothetical protein